MLAAAVTLAFCGCGPAAQEPTLAHGARVQFKPRASPRASVAAWQSGVMGTVGPCLAVMVPDSWSEPRRFDVRLVDSIAAIRVSSRFDGLPGPDGTPRVYRIPADTAGESWRELPIAPLRARYGGCTP